MYLLVAKRNAFKVGIVCAVEENIVNASHAQDQRDDGDGSNLVFEEKALRSDKAACNPKKDHEGAKRRHPPTYKQRRLVMPKGLEAGRLRVDGHLGRPKTIRARRPPQRERRAREEANK